MINKYNICLLTTGIFLIFYKAIELGFIVADNKKIDGCSSNSNNYSASSWLFVSSIFGLVACLFFGFKGINSYLMIISACSDIYMSLDSYEFFDVNELTVNKIAGYVMFVFQVVLTAYGGYLCFSQCADISPDRINVLFKMSVVVNFIQLFVMGAVIQYHSFAKSIMNDYRVTSTQYRY